MNSCCGQSYYQVIKNKNTMDDVLFNEKKLANHGYGFSADIASLYSAYLGKVNVNLCSDESKRNFILEHKINIGGKELLVKVIDCIEYNLNPRLKYDLSQLERLEGMRINLTDNVFYYYATLLVSKHIAKQENRVNDIKEIKDRLEELKNDPNFASYNKRVKNEYPKLLTEESTQTLSTNKKMRKDFLKYNTPVDILFNVLSFLSFLYEKTGIVGVNNQKSLICLANIDELDNAFWTGSYMIFGNGKDKFFPLASLDVVGHELSHGLIQGLPDLEYKAHSGALNESFADIIGTMFEFYMYDKYNNNSNDNDDIRGKEDWLIGEDLDMSGKYLRNMKSPEDSPQPQPSTYQGKHYLDPNVQIDHGGVHINSGIPNHCFYLLSQSVSKEKSFELFFKCLKRLGKYSDFIDFRDTLKSIEADNTNVSDALDKVGLTASAVTDVKNNQIPKQKPRSGPEQEPPCPCPPCPHKRKRPYPQPQPHPNPNKRQRPPYPQPFPNPNQRPPFPQPFPQPFPNPNQRPPFPQPFPQPFPNPNQRPPFPQPFPNQRPPFPQPFPNQRPPFPQPFPNQRPPFPQPFPNPNQRFPQPFPNQRFPPNGRLNYDFGYEY